MVYNEVFSPILQVGHTVVLKGSSFPEEGANYKCIAIDALPYYEKNFGALSAATWSQNNEDTNLELSTNELGQLRMFVKDDIKLRLHNPVPVTHWRTAKTNFWLPQFPESDQDWIQQYWFKMSEFFYWERDNKPAFDLYSTLAATTSYVGFTGYKFKLQKTTTAGLFTLQVDSWPGIR